MQKVLMGIIYTALQNHNHLNLHFCLPTKQWIPVPGAFISLRFAPSACWGSHSVMGHGILLNKMEIQMPSYLGL